MQFAFIIPAGPDKDGHKARHPQEQVRQNFRIAYKGKRPYPLAHGNVAVNDAKELVAQYTMVAMRKADIRKVTSESLEITLVFFFTRTPAQNAATRQIPFPSITPDVDNLSKLVMDGMNKVLYTDDCKVIQAPSFKRYTHQDAHTVVGVRSLEDKEAMPPWDVYDHLAWMKDFVPTTW